jgi:hypothetical protein
MAANILSMGAGQSRVGNERFLDHIRAVRDKRRGGALWRKAQRVRLS